MKDKKEFGHQDFPEHRRHLEEQARNLGMEACVTHEQRAAYIRRLVRGIFKGDLPDVRVIGTRIVFGEKSLTPIPEFERILNEWGDFPQNEIVRIIAEEQRYARGEHLRLVENETSQDSEKDAA